MSDLFTFECQKREDLGKGASRRLRREAGLTPAIVYGGEKEPLSITLAHKNLWRAQEEEEFYTSALTLNVDGASEQVLIKDLQRHPAKNQIMHVDFIRLDDSKPVVVTVPLHFINEEKCFGVRMQGGKISRTARDVKVRCLPKDLPTFIEIDMENVNAGQIIHISDLNLGEGVESVALAMGADYDLALAQVAGKKGKQDDDAEAAPAAE